MSAKIRTLAPAPSDREGPAAPSRPGPEGEVASPCINVCKMDARSGLCEGCFRTIDEIACWSGASREEKLAVLAKCEARKRAAG